MLRLSRRFLATLKPQEELAARMEKLQKHMAKHLPETTADPHLRDLSEPREKTMEERLAILDEKVSNIESLREAGRPEEIRIKNLDNKYGRVGRFPAYPWYGEYVEREDRMPHVADRLGKYSTVAPVEGELHYWLQMHSDLNNPSFQSFFSQEPNREPDVDLNFEKGEVLYENPDAMSGITLFKQLGLTSGAYFLYNIAHTISTGRATYPVGDEFLDIRADSSNMGNNWLVTLLNFGPSWHDLEMLSSFAFVGPIVPLVAWTYLTFLNMTTGDIVYKMEFNKEKNLLFVQKLKGLFFPKPVEEVFEVDHLQVLPPSLKSGYDTLVRDKLITMSCMNTQESFILYKDDKYWHPETGKDFKNSLYHMWR